MSTTKTLRYLTIALLLCSCWKGAARISWGRSPNETVQQANLLRTTISNGQQKERTRQWLDAIEFYEDALKKHPDVKELELGLRRSKVHFSIERRYADGSFEQRMLTTSQFELLDMFDLVLQRVRENYVDTISSTSFVAHGTESLYLALANSKFINRNIPSADRQRIRQMRVVLREQYWNKSVGNGLGARRTISEICDLGRRLLGLQASPIVLEYIFGGCNSLDDYSCFLTPDRLDDLYGNIDGSFVGLGIEMKAVKPKGMLLVKVLPDSPADRGGMRAGEFITEIDGTNCREMTTDEAAKLLRGPSLSRVRLGIHNPMKDNNWKHTFTRRAVQVKSVTVSKIIDSHRRIGYIQMTGFQKTTPRELQQAIAKLKAEGMQALIWDLRGNPGGLLTASIKVLEQFIDHGILVETRGRALNQDFSYRASEFNQANQLPLVLLVDGDSASASEIVAGAIRDHRRGTIVGRQTYGKWSVQTILPLTNSTGLRLTTARFYSPNGHSLGKIGVRPDRVVSQLEFEKNPQVGDDAFQPERDADIQQGLQILRTQLSRK